MLRIEKLNFSYGDREVFRDFSAVFSAEKINFLTGESGVGKTTLLKILAGLLPSNGAVKSDLKGVSYMFQEPRLVPQLTVFDNIKLALSSIAEHKEIRRKVILSMLTAAGLGDSAYLYPHELSGGMAQRAALARAFLFKADLILLDEPFKALDEANKKLMADLLKEHKKTSGSTVIYVTHDIEDTKNFGEANMIEIKKNI